MRNLKLLLTLLLTFTLLCAGPAKPEVIGTQNQVFCNQLVFQATSVASLQTILAGVNGRTIFICGWHVTATTAGGTFQLSQGTGTNCGTTNTVFTPAYGVATSAPSTDHISAASISLPLGNNLCVISSSTNLQIGIWVGQY